MEQANDFKNKGNDFFKAGQWEQAYEMYTKAIELNPNDHIFYSNRSGCLVKMNKNEEALSDAEKSLEINPSYVRGYSRKGIALYNLNKKEEAVKAYEEGLKFEPTNQTLLDAIQNIKNENEGSNPQMNPILMQLFKHPKFLEYMKDPSFVAIVSDLQQNPNNLMKYLSDPRVQDLMSIFTQGMNPGGNNNNNNSKPEEGPKFEEKPKEQSKKQESTTKPTPNPVDSKKVIADNLYKNKKFSEAIEKYNELYSENPKNLLLKSNVSACYIELNDLENAEKVLEEALEVYENTEYADRNPEHFAKILTRKARIYELKKDYSTALELLSKAELEFKIPTNIEIIRRLKRLKLESDKLAYINPELSEKHREAGNVLFKEGKFKECIEEYEEANKRNPKDVRMHLNLSLVYIKIMKYDIAMDWTNKGLDIEPSNIKLLMRKAKVYNCQKEYHKSIDIYQSILKSDPSNTEAKNALAETEMKVNMGMAGGASGNDEERAKRAMSDPEIQSIISDPMVKIALQKMQENPQSAMEYFNDSNLGPKLNKLINAGIIRMGP